MSVMSIEETEPRSRKLTSDDLKWMPDDGRRYELVDGRLDVSPSPKPGHGRAVHRLSWLLETVCVEGFEIFEDTGIDFNAQRTHHRRPDLFVYKDLDLPAVGYFDTPPVLAVEVISPESRLRDHHTKRREYADFGITSYWIVEPDALTPSIIEFRLEGTEFRSVSEVVGLDVFETDEPFPVKLTPHWLTSNGPWKAHIGGE